jgi:hypothetical protein
MKIHPVGAELFHADRQRETLTKRWTDMTTLVAAFRSFANAPKRNESLLGPLRYVFYA